MILDLIQGTDKSKGDDPDAAGQLNESICGPSYKNDWIDSLTVYLSFEEASFLSGKIGANVPLSLLGQLLLDADVVCSFLNCQMTGILHRLLITLHSFRRFQTKSS